MDLHLFEGNAELRMHQLFASFLLATAVSGKNRAMLEQVRSLQMGRLVELAKDLAAHPASSELAAALLAFPLNPENWDGLPLGISIEDSQAVGFASVEIGQFAEAQPWYERAVAEAEQGDVHGRIDHESLGTSLREVRNVCAA